MSEELPKPEELIQVAFNPPKTNWMDAKADFRRGTWSYSGKPKALERAMERATRRVFDDFETLANQP